MTEQTMREVVKSFAYGASTKDVAEAFGIPISDSENIRRDRASEIEERAEELKDGGWL